MQLRLLRLKILFHSPLKLFLQGDHSQQSSIQKLYARFQRENVAQFLPIPEMPDVPHQLLLRILYLPRLRFRQSRFHHLGHRPGLCRFHLPIYHRYKAAFSVACAKAYGVGKARKMGHLLRIAMIRKRFCAEIMD